jgi:hypothetical protein
VSANSRDSVERIRQTPSDESASRKFADVVCLMIGVVNGAGTNLPAKRRPRSAVLRALLTLVLKSEHRRRPELQNVWLWLGLRMEEASH